MNLALIVLVGVAALLLSPAYVIGTLPFLMLLAVSGLEPVLVPALEGGIHLYDVAIAAALARAVVRGSFKRHIRLHQVHARLTVFALVLILGVIAGYVSLGADHLLRTGRSLVRFLFESTVMWIVAAEVVSKKDLRRLVLALAAFGVVVALNVYVNTTGYRFGFTIGEVQYLPSGGIRSFGVVGDQAGFILSLYVAWGLARASLPIGIFFLGAILLTGTLGALLTLTVTLVALLLPRRPSWLGLTVDSTTLGLRAAPPRVMVAAGAAALLILMGVGPALDRLMGAASLSGLQRLATARVTLRVIADAPLLGVGFLGLPTVAPGFGLDALFRPLGGVAPNYVATAGNQLLQTAADAGVLGLVGLVLFLWSAGKTFSQVSTSLRSAGDDHSHVGSAVHSGRAWFYGLVFGNFTAVWLLPGSLLTLLLWILLGLTVALARVSQSGARRLTARIPSAA